jgi:hypothetical protein
VKQTIEGAPAGLYKMTAQGFYRQDGENDEPAPVFFIGGKTADVPVKTGDENGMGDASNSFSNGLYTIEPIEFKLFADGNIELGVKQEEAFNQWIIFDNFKLEYCGPVETPTYTLVGAVKANSDAEEEASLFQTAWSPNETSNDFDQSELDPDKGIYTKVYTGVALAPGSTIYYKVVADHDWAYNWGFNSDNANYVVNLPMGETLPEGNKVGIFNITFKFNPAVPFANGFNVDCEAFYDVETTTGIHSIASESQNGTIYNLNGQKVTKAQKGLYIVNGRKQVVR